MYNPYDWYWQIGEDTSRFWSSKTGRYTFTHPGEFEGMTKIASEEELTDVLAVYGLPGPSVKIPDRVSPAQAEIALYNHDNGVLLAQVNALIDTYPYEPVRIWWRKATYIARDHPYIWAIAIELDLSVEEVDALFVAAALITGLSEE